MHLDTVFTMVDYDKFTIHPEIQGNLRVFSVTYENEALKIVEEKGDLAELLAENLGVEKVTLIPCGDGNVVAVLVNNGTTVQILYNRTLCGSRIRP